MRLKLLGETMDVITSSDMFAFVKERVRSGSKGIIASHNLHSLSLMNRPKMRALYQMSDLVLIDSMLLVAWAKICRLPVARENRCTYLDHRTEFWNQVAENKWRVFFLGGEEGVGKAAVKRIKQDFPMVLVGMIKGDLDICTRNGYFDMNGPENDAKVAAINKFKPDIILVGMGMPRQEQWIVDNFHKLDQGVVMAVGAAFDYEAGVQKAAPRWMGRMGIEWAYRLVSDPRRLFVRYLIEPWVLIPRLVSDLLFLLRP